MKAMTAPRAEHEMRLQGKDREIEVLFGRIKAIRQASREVGALEAQVGALEAQVGALEAQVGALEARLEEILHSSSWAVTAPMRVAKTVASRVLTRLSPPPPATLGAKPPGPTEGVRADKPAADASTSSSPCTTTFTAQSIVWAVS